MTPRELDAVMLDLVVIVMITPIAVLVAAAVAIYLKTASQIQPHERAAICWATRRFLISVIAVVTCVMALVGCGGSGGSGQGHTVINQPAENDTTAPGSDGICQP